MCPERRNSHEDMMPRATISRRSLLAASGLVAVGSLAGCLNRVASSVTNTGASPAAVFAGTDWNDDDTAITPTFQDWSLGSPHVARLTPTLAERVELEGWVTSVSVTTEDYNTPRSNRSIARPVDFFGDDVDESDETFRTVSQLDSQLSDAIEAAVSSISKRSARTGPNPETEKEITAAVDDIDEVLADLRAVLERCTDESCVAALENVERRAEGVRQARIAIENEEWDAAIEAVSSPIYEGDAVGGESALNRDAIAPPDGPLDEADREALVEYLGGEPVVGERFTICLPDAEVPGGNGSIREAVTPKRFIDYLTGRSDTDGRVYTWGSGTAAADGGGDCDDGGVCGSPHLSAALSGPVSNGGGLVASRQSDGTLMVVSSPPSSEGGASTLVCPVEGEAYEPDDLNEWSVQSATDDKASPILFDCLAQPPGCPNPIPAVMYLSREVSDGQFIYSGGWVIDNAALYSNSVTLLTLSGERVLVPVDAGLFEGDYHEDGLADVVARAGLSERALRGAQIASGTVSALVKTGTLSEDGGGTVYCWGSNDYSKENSGSCGETGEDGGEVMVTHCPLDAPILHLVNAGSASSDVKFKTGAELSKSAN